MFTGIIESKGEIISIANKINSREFTVSLDSMFDDVNIGDSIAVNGVCLTATGISSNQINFDVISETLEKSNLGDLITGSEVNLERALSLSSRINGSNSNDRTYLSSSIVEISKSGKSNTALRKSPFVNSEDISFPSLSHSLNLSDNLIIGSIVGRNPRFESILNSFNILDFIGRIDYWSTWSGI